MTITSSVMKNKLSVAALAVFSVLGLSYSSLASATDSQNFTTNITVSSPFDCPVTTSAATTEWDLTWKLTNETDVAGTLSYTSVPTQPLPILVGLDTGASANCDLSGMKFDATVAAGDVTPVTGYDGYFLKQTSNGFWRYAPVLSRIELYSDASQTTAVTGTVTVTDANGGSHEQSDTALYTAQNAITGLAGMNKNAAVSLSNNYLDAKAAVPLAGPSLVSFTMGTETVVKSASVDVSAIIANDPEDATGTTDVAAVNNLDVVSLPFTVNVSYH